MRAGPFNCSTALPVYKPLSVRFFSIQRERRTESYNVLETSSICLDIGSEGGSTVSCPLDTAEDSNVVGIFLDSESMEEAGLFLIETFLVICDNRGQNFMMPPLTTCVEPLDT
ncbi:hypothetical protein EMPS_00114 [Entomortierella parvispora]|uniref:Uncharacterized protein n=1 Tax=Entomortierella parvispora TaxID=205924 RepID=A0A9P3H145_9FUNG|nr:hypothetical protein EMPS_00114 [Entomortierella parvispora]